MEEYLKDEGDERIFLKAKAMENILKAKAMGKYLEGEGDGGIF